jgi:asparagine synthase (glutamine-hydrolysing)
MCGITCAVALRGAEKRDKTWLDSALDKSLNNIKHRGPDAKGWWISDHCRVGMATPVLCHYSE